MMQASQESSIKGSAKVTELIRTYADGLYCAAMMGGPGGSQRSSGALATFKQKLQEIRDEKAEFSEQDTRYLLKMTIHLNAEAFLFTFKLIGNFPEFMIVLDELQPKMDELQRPQSTTRQQEFFKLTLAANPTKLPDIEDFKLYRAMQRDMLSQLKTQVEVPDANLIKSTVEKYEPKFIREKPEARAGSHSMDTYIKALSAMN